MGGAAERGSSSPPAASAHRARKATLLLPSAVWRRARARPTCVSVVFALRSLLLFFFFFFFSARARSGWPTPSPHRQRAVAPVLFVGCLPAPGFRCACVHLSPVSDLLDGVAGGASYGRRRLCQWHSLSRCNKTRAAVRFGPVGRPTHIPPSAPSAAVRRAAATDLVRRPVCLYGQQPRRHRRAAAAPLHSCFMLCDSAEGRRGTQCAFAPPTDKEQPCIWSTTAR